MLQGAENILSTAAHKEIILQFGHRSIFADSNMYVEVYDDYKATVFCTGNNVVHSMTTSSVKLTYGTRLQSVFVCKDCNLEFIKLTRRNLEYNKNHERTFREFVCVQYKKARATYN